MKPQWVMARCLYLVRERSEGAARDNGSTSCLVLMMGKEAMMRPAEVMFGDAEDRQFSAVQPIYTRPISIPNLCTSVNINHLRVRLVQALLKHLRHRTQHVQALRGESEDLLRRLSHSRTVWLSISVWLPCVARRGRTRRRS